MGLKQLLAEFVKYMTHMLWKYINNFVAIYFDDIIVFSKDITKHDKHVQKIMRKTNKSWIILNIKKYKFNTIKINYLEMVFLPEELEISKKKNWTQS